MKQHSSNEMIAEEENIALRAWLHLKKAVASSEKLSITIEKNIPIAAGMGGGSSDAAAVLIGANHLLQLDLHQDELMQIGLGIGADVPFCLTGGLARVEGIGEIISPIVHPPKRQLLLINPGFAVSTAEVYKNYHLQGQASSADSVDIAATQQFLSADIHSLQPHLGNDLEGVAFALHPQIESIKLHCKQLGLVALMSGSGGSVWALAEDESQLQKAEEKLRMQYPIVLRAETLPHGIKIIA